MTYSPATISSSLDLAMAQMGDGDGAARYIYNRDDAAYIGRSSSHRALRRLTARFGQAAVG
jgi:hypothetical protein